MASTIRLKHIIPALLLTGALSPAVHAQQAEQVPVINGEAISTELAYESHYIEVLGSRLHYIDEGEGKPVLFIHGNPTSSYLWRNVIPYVAHSQRAIAIDLIGMGRSDKPDIDYTYLDHRRYVFAFIEALELEDIALVIHDWGSVLGFDYAMQHPNNVRGIAFMEALVPPRFPVAAEPASESIFGQFRSSGPGEKLIIDENYFVERMLPGGVVRTLAQEEMDTYRQPYLDPAARKPVLQWPRELPMGGRPTANVEIIEDIGEWMTGTDTPMLYFWGRSGPSPNHDSTANWYSEHLRNVETRFLGESRHYVQEDHPETIGRSIHDWLRRIEQDN